MSIEVEIAVEDLAGLEVAAHAGAHRVELCADLARGGLTPPTELVERAAHRAAALVAAGDARAAFEVHVLLRSRADADVVPGDLVSAREFVHTAEEVRALADRAAEAVGAGAHGVVLGALTPERTLDVPALETLRDAALTAGQAALRGVVLSAHRAVDLLPDTAARVDAVETLLGLGLHRVLSSGGARRAPDGADDLAAMVRAAGGILEIVAGAGIRPADIGPLVAATGVDGIHLSARSRTGTPDDAPTATDPAIATAAVDAAGAL